MGPEEPIVLWSCCLRAGIVKLGHLRRMEGLDWKTTAAVRGVRCDISETSGEAERAGAGLAVSITAGLLQSGKGGGASTFPSAAVGGRSRRSKPGVFLRV